MTGLVFQDMVQVKVWAEDNEMSESEDEQEESSKLQAACKQESDEDDQTERLPDTVRFAFFLFALDT